MQKRHGIHWLSSKKRICLVFFVRLANIMQHLLWFLPPDTKLWLPDMTNNPAARIYLKERGIYNRVWEEDTSFIKFVRNVSWEPGISSHGMYKSEL